MKTIKNLFLIFTFFLMTAKKADAYLDPGTGSFMFQIIIGSIIGAIFTAKIYFKKIKLFFLSLFQKKKNDRQ